MKDTSFKMKDISLKMNDTSLKMNDKSLKMKACSKVNGDNYSPKAESENED